MKLPQISGRELVKKLHKYGFIAVRQKGSHLRLEKRTSDKVIKITVPMHPVLKKGTLKQILKDCEITLEEFEKL